MKSREFLNMCTKWTWSVMATKLMFYCFGSLGSKGFEKSPKMVLSRHPCLNGDLSLSS